MSVPFTRELRFKDVGLDVEGVGRALTRAGLMRPYTIRDFQGMPDAWRRTHGQRRVDAVNLLRKGEGWTENGLYDLAVHTVLVDAGAFDSKAASLMKAHRVLSKEELAFERLLTEMKLLSDASSGYLLGAGHGVDLLSRPATAKWDCSSSSARVLRAAKLFPEDRAWVSGKFATSYGVPGPGKFITVYANAAHVFIRLHSSRWWRFDTSPHGEGGRGPRLRMLPRFTGGFTARHWPGM